MMAAGKKVVVLGGGIAGMSAAHELIERGFEVEIFERKPIAGGKARSLDASPTTGLVQTGSRGPQRPAWQGGPLPGEHGFRFFPGFYRHVTDTMSRIPCGAGTVDRNLIGASVFQIASFDRPPFLMPAVLPRNPTDLKVDFFAAVGLLSGGFGVSPDDSAFFATKLWEIATSCEERRLVELERINWWDFIEAGSRSKAYQKYFGNGITRSLVAAKARRASTKTIGDIFLQLVFEVAYSEVPGDRILNGPTNEVWIAPWLQYLRAKGVEYHLDARVLGIRFDKGRAQSATVSIGNRVRDVTGDYFIGALPVERMRELLSPELLQLDPSLASLHELTEYLEWMNGIQFYLYEDIQLADGHTIYIDTPWALTSVSQPRFWKDFDISRLGDGTVKGILSVDISDWDVKGLNGKQARQCTRHEIALETWEQLKKSLNVGSVTLRDDQLHSWYLDPGIDDTNVSAESAVPRLVSNAEPLLVNYVDTWRIRPEAVTRIPNFFLASDYVRTFTDLATMEAANEAARRAVNGIILASRSAQEPCKIWNLHEPEAFVPFRAYDRVQYRRGLPWGGKAVDRIRSAAEQVGKAVAAAPLIGTGLQHLPAGTPDPIALIARPEPAPASAPRGVDDTEAVAADARESSDTGLRRLRLMGPAA